MSDDDTNGGPNHLAAWRELRGLSQEQLANAVGSTSGMISHLETDKRQLSAKWLRRLARALETTPGMLLDNDPKDIPPDLITLFKRADRDQIRQISQLAETVLAFSTQPRQRE